MQWPHRPKLTTVRDGKTLYAPHYFRWRAMRARCEQLGNSMYHLYGARGITVCPEWQDFWCFYDWVIATIEPGKSIDRIDNNGWYHPDNCRWATPKEQQVTARRTQARIDGMLYASTFKRAHRKYRVRNDRGQFVGN